MSISPLDLVSAGTWDRAVFTTYALSLSFFEGVVLDALMRGKSKEALILADVVGVKAALGEQGARRAGRDYQVEPVVVASGCFHPKVSVFTSGSDVHLLVGSGNLTFGGWGNNLEILEHLHPSFAREAVLDAADFFEQLTNADRLQHGAARSCEATAQSIRESVSELSPSNPAIRFVSSLRASIAEQILEFADDLGPAQRLLVASPFWDVNGRAIESLCGRLGLDQVFVHSHPNGVVESALGLNWPWNAKTQIQPIQIDVIDEESGDRRLHAKAFEITFEKGRMLVSGSANATTAALGAGNNVEACVVRIMRDRSASWAFTNSSAPGKPTANPIDEVDDKVGVLRAILDQDVLTGKILTGIGPGPAFASMLTSDGSHPIGDVNISEDGSFRFRAPNLEFQAWNAGRTILRIETNDQAAEGFISLAAISAIIRRIGPAARSLLALLTMTETPSDVATVMAWLHEDPDRLATISSISRAGALSSEQETPETRSVHLSEIGAREGESGGGFPNVVGGEASSMRRFLEQIYSAFRKPAARTADLHDTDDDDGDDDDGDDHPNQGKRFSGDREHGHREAFAAFNKLLEIMLDEHHRGRHLASAIDLTLFVCDRLDHQFADAKGWWTKILGQCEKFGTPDNRQPELTAVVLAMMSHLDSNGRDRQTRSRLQRLGLSGDGDAIDFPAIPGIVSLAGEGVDLDYFWHQVRSTTSYAEQNRAFFEDLRGGRQSDRYPDLMANLDIWPVLSKALEGQANRALELTSGAIACPKCYITLPKSEQQRLRSRYVAVAANCCHRVLLETGA